MSNSKKFYLKRDCRGCKALQEGLCLLGYEIVLETPDPLMHPSICWYIPKEVCPKPKKAEQLARLLAERKNT